MNVIKINSSFKKYILIISLCAIVSFKGLLGYNNLNIHFIDVGQGDSIFIEFPGKKNMLIDTGNANDDYIAAEKKVIPYIKRLGYSSIDYLLITHFHSDHSGGVTYIESVMNIDKRISYEASKKEDYIGASIGDTLEISGVRLNILSPRNTYENIDENKNSIIFELLYGEFSALFTGDATESEMDYIMGNYDVLKVPHHGSKYSVSKKMLSQSSINTAVITVGKNNFGHPSKECMDSLLKESVKIYRTDRDGNIVYNVNKKRYKIKFNN